MHVRAHHQHVPYLQEKVPLAWVNQALFDYKGTLRSGTVTLPCWIVNPEEPLQEILNPIGTYVRIHAVCVPCTSVLKLEAHNCFKRVSLNGPMADGAHAWLMGPMADGCGGMCTYVCSPVNTPRSTDNYTWKKSRERMYVYNALLPHRYSHTES